MSDSQSTTPPSNIDIRRSGDFRRVYSNLFRYRILPTETSIVFSLATDNAGAANVNQIIEEYDSEGFNLNVAYPVNAGGFFDATCTVTNDKLKSQYNLVGIINTRL